MTGPEYEDELGAGEAPADDQEPPDSIDAQPEDPNRPGRETPEPID